MKNTLIFGAVLLGALTLPAAVEAQKFMKIPKACAVDDTEMGSEHYVFDPSQEAQGMVKEITEANFVKPNFILKSGSVENALAFVDQGQRFILYNTAFIERIKSSAGTDWAAIFVFAHEIGHHQNYHDFTGGDNERRREQELEADVYAGSMMYMLGATLAEAQAGIENVVGERGSATHPPRRARTEAVANGWKRAKERVPVQPARIKLGGSTNGGGTTTEPDNMVLIPGGTFPMGSEDDADEKPVHSVTVKDFYLGKYEVTVAEFSEFVEATGYRTDAEKGDGSTIYGGGSSWTTTTGIHWRHDAEGKTAADNHPVIHVSWNDATAYCQWLSQKTGRAYRLPTEAEWEYAAGNGSRHTKYSWGDGSPTGKNGGNVADESKRPSDEASWSPKFDGFNDGYWSTAPVGTYNPNSVGLYDMTGNVWEWCNDWYGDYSSSSQTNPTGPFIGSVRVFRGGSWSNDPQKCQVAYRAYTTPGNRRNSVGFRLARTK